MKKIFISLLTSGLLILSANEFIVKNDTLKTNIKVVTEKQNGQEVKTVFRDNKEVKKIITSYYKNGKIKTIEEKVNNQLNGVIMEYYESGSIKCKTYYKDNAINGLKITYNEKGELISEESYSNNLKDGISNIYKNGKAETFIYKKGNLSNN